MMTISRYFVNGHRGLDIPGLISNPEVKKSSVPGSTVLMYGNSGKLFHLFLTKTLINLFNR